MQKQARITSKGQITVPHEIRKFLGVKPGDDLMFETTGACTAGSEEKSLRKVSRHREWNDSIR